MGPEWSTHHTETGKEVRFGPITKRMHPLLLSELNRMAEEEFPNIPKSRLVVYAEDYSFGISVVLIERMR